MILLVNGEEADVRDAITLFVNCSETSGTVPSIVPDERQAGFTIADPSDLGMLDVAGFDAAVPNLVADFSRGDT